MKAGAPRMSPPPAPGAAPTPLGAPPTIVEGLYSFQIGGSEKLAALLARQLALRGYRVRALSFFDYDGPVRAELERAGIACDGLGLLQRSRMRKLTLQWETRVYFKRHAPQVVHLHHGATAMKGARAAHDVGARVVITEHSDQTLREDARYRRGTCRAIESADAVTVINAELYEYFGDGLRTPAGKLALVPNAVDPAYSVLARDDSARAALGLADAFVFAFVGRLVPEKDLGTLLRAFQALRAQALRPVRLVLAGDGMEREALHALGTSLGLDADLRWLGAQPSAAPALALADAFVMSSRSEGVPMALLEAMAAGLPCIATDVGGIAHTLSGGRGIVVPPEQPAALAAAMLRVLQEPAQARALAAAGRTAIAEQYSVDSVVDRYLDVFRLPRRWPVAAA